MSNTHTFPATELPTPSAMGRAASAIANTVVGFFTALDQSGKALREYNRHANMSTDQLKALNLSRETIAQHIIATHLTF